MSLRVWAPCAQSVELVRPMGCVFLQRGEHGCWQSPVELRHGEDYALRVDGKGPFPDPRSPWQPYGVHGHSRWVEHASFSWSDRGWQPPPLASALIYELHIGTFTAEGTFAGAITKLDALRELGVTHIELMPVAAFSGSRGWGYDGVALYAPHQAYGGPDGLKQLVDACHVRGIAVVLDVVYNHLGPDGNYLEQFGAYFTAQYQTPWGRAINFDGAGSDAVRRFFIDNALMWLRDYHIDGLRIDAVHAIFDKSAQHFLEQLVTEIHQLESALGRHLVVIAESDLNDPRLVRPNEVGGYALEAQWNDDFHHALHTVLTGESRGYYADFGRIADIATALTQGFVFDGRYSPYRDRRHGRTADGVSSRQFIGFLQNHDQIGNRAYGERIGHLVSLGRLAIGAALVLTAPFIPMLFQGEEWGASAPFRYFTDYADSALGQAVYDGRREEFAAFGWNPQSLPDPQSPENFRRSVLDWSERDQISNAAILNWYRGLIELRRKTPDLAAGAATHVRYDEQARWLLCMRGEIMVICNFAEIEQVIALEKNRLHEMILAFDGDVVLSDHEVRLSAESVAILRSINES